MTTQALTALAEKLEDKKHLFLGELRSSVSAHVSSKRTEDCLVVVTKPAAAPHSAGVNWYWNDGLPYVSRLISFLRKKDHRDGFSTYHVDSILTEEVATIVADSFSSFYTSERDLISEYAIAHILENQTIANGLIDSLVEGSKLTRYASKRIKHEIKDIMLGGLLSQTDYIQSKIGHSIVVGTSKVTAAIVSSKLAVSVGAAASSAIGKVIVRKVALYVSKNIGAVAAKVMAVPIIKALVMKFAVAAIISAFVKFIAVKTGVGIGAAVAIVLLPLLAAVLIHEWTTFPEKLGKSIADSISNELSDSFVATNKQALSHVFQELLEDQVTAIGKHLAGDEEVAEQISELLDFVDA